MVPQSPPLVSVVTLPRPEADAVERQITVGECRQARLARGAEAISFSWVRLDCSRRQSDSGAYPRHVTVFLSVRLKGKVYLMASAGPSRSPSLPRDGGQHRQSE